MIGSRVVDFFSTNRIGSNLSHEVSDIVVQPAVLQHSTAP